MADELTGLPSGWVVVSDAPPQQQSSNEPISTKGGGLPMVAAGKAALAGGHATEAVTDAASRLRVNPSVALDQFSLNQPQKILKAVSMTAPNPLRPASPAETIAKRIAPYAQTLSTLGTVQGALDLHQMAEPNRKDIGFLGVGGGTHDDTDPALLNLIASKLSALFGGK